MPASVTLSQLESHLWEAANFLRGSVGTADFKSYVFPLRFFKRLVPLGGIRTKEENLSIPLYGAGETQSQSNAAAETATTALPYALAAWLRISAAVRHSLGTFVQPK